MTLDPVAVEVLSRIGPRLVGGGAVARTLEADASNGRLSAILDEIADTILPRTLRFDCAEATCALVVSNARVLEVNAAKANDEACDTRDTKLALVARTLHEFTRSPGPLSVTPQRYGLEPTGDMVGITCRELGDHCKKRGWLADKSEPPQPALPFDEALLQASIASAELSSDGSVTATSGDIDYLPDEDELRALWADVAPLLGRSGPKQHNPLWLVVENAKNASASAVVVHAGPEWRRVCVIGAGQVPSLARLWASERTGERPG